MKRASFLLILLLSSCAAQPGGNWIGANVQGDAGDKPMGYEDPVVSDVKSSLKDPYSAHIEVGTPYLLSCAIGVYGPFWGWAVPVRVNAKNSYGAYIGEQTYYYWFDKGCLRKVTGDVNYCPEPVMSGFCVPTSTSPSANTSSAPTIAPKLGPVIMPQTGDDAAEHELVKTILQEHPPKHN